MSNAIPIPITNIRISIAGIRLRFDTPFVDMYEKIIDSMNVITNTCINHVVVECSSFLFMFSPF